MGSRLVQLILLVTLSATANADDSGQEPELPLCPVNVQYFPQNLPMHCRMPIGGPPPPIGIPPGFPMPGGIINAVPPSPDGNARPERAASAVSTPGFASPPPNKMVPYPFPMPPGFPAPILPPPPMGMPMPLIPGPPPPQKLPVIVMPFYAPDPAAFKKQKGHRVFPTTRRPRRKPSRKKHRKQSSESCSTSDSGSSTSGTDSSESSSSSELSDGAWRRRRNMNRRSYRKGNPKNSHGRRRRRRKGSVTTRRASNNAELLTPLIQYVTNDGYVIYEKEISKNEAKDWLNVAKKDDTHISFQELDEINKNLPGDGQGDANQENMLTAAELEKNKTELEEEVKKVEQELFIEEKNAVKTEKPKPKQWRKNIPKTRKEKFAEKIGTNVESLI